MKTAKEFYLQFNYKKPFTKLTSTGISDDLDNVFEFAEIFANAKAKAVLEEAAEITPWKILYRNSYGELCVGVHGDSVVTDQWKEHQEKIRSLIPEEQ